MGQTEIVCFNEPLRRTRGQRKQDFKKHAKWNRNQEWDGGDDYTILSIYLKSTELYNLKGWIL